MTDREAIAARLAEMRALAEQTMQGEWVQRSVPHVPLLITALERAVELLDHDADYAEIRRILEGENDD